jgi:hypothetical protein
MLICSLTGYWLNTTFLVPLHMKPTELSCSHLIDSTRLLSRLVIYLTTLFQQNPFCCDFSMIDTWPQQKTDGCPQSRWLQFTRCRFPYFIAGLTAAHILKPFTTKATPVWQAPLLVAVPITCLQFPTWTRQTCNSIQTRQTRLHPIWRISANTTNLTRPSLRKYKGIRSSIRRVQCNLRRHWRH